MTRRIVRSALVGAVALGAMTVTAATAPRQAPPTQTAPVATGVIVGSVVDGDNGAPIAGAIVRILGQATPGAGRPGMANTIIATGGDGRFLFRNLPKGRYVFVVQKPGYITGFLGQRSPTSEGIQQLDLDEGQRTKDVSISLWKFASLSGTVVDEAGEPLVGATVKACRRIVLAGRVKLDFQSPVGAALTDDRGIYRQTELLPGDYVVVVASSSITVPAAVQDSYNQALRDGNNILQAREVDATSAVVPSTSGARVGDYVVSFGRAETGTSGVFRRPGPGELPLTPDGRQMVYRSTFYPNAARSTEAAVVTLKTGEDRTGIDVQLRPVVGTHISGRLMGPDGPQALFGLRLMAEGQDELNIDSGLMNPATITNARGEFVFLGVPAGQYTLRAIRQPPRAARGPGTPPGPLPIPTESTLWASVPLRVPDQGLDGVEVMLSRGLRVSGRVEFEGTAAKPAPERLPQITIDLDTSDARSSFRAVYGVLGQNTPVLGRVETDGQFTTFGVPAQKYILTVANLPQGWTLKSAMLNGRDISYTPLEIVDSSIDGVVVALTDRPSKLSGVVRSADGQVDATADVLVFPTDKSGWIDGGISPRRVQLIRVGRNGSYSFSGLPPGEYFVAAIPDERAANATDTKVLEGFTAGATRVRVADGAAVVQDLQTLRVK